MTTTKMTKTEATSAEIRELTVAELEQAAGGRDGTLKDWKYCEKGTTSGGGPGLYPWYVTCK